MCVCVVCVCVCVCGSSVRVRAKGRVWVRICTSGGAYIKNNFTPIPLYPALYIQVQCSQVRVHKRIQKDCVAVAASGVRISEGEGAMGHAASALAFGRQVRVRVRVRVRIRVRIRVRVRSGTVCRTQLTQGRGTPRV